LALLATAYERPVEARVLVKLWRACERWTEGDKALAHLLLAHAGLPPCGPDQALRLFVADELIEAGVTPETLMKAQNFDPGPLDLLKANFNPDQPRVPAGSGRESGEWTDGEANFTPFAFRPRRRHRGGRSWIDAIRGFLERLPELLKPKEGEPVPEAKPSHEEAAEPKSAAPKASSPELEISPQSRPTSWVKTSENWRSGSKSRISISVDFLSTGSLEPKHEVFQSMIYKAQSKTRFLSFVNRQEDSFIFLTKQ
jgi:hypothetical protein